LKIIAIIPARYQSRRLPNKVLAEIAGQSILYRVYKQVEKSNIFDEIIIATDHPKVENHCHQHKINVKMTSPDHISGTDRIAEVISDVEADIIINIQGDEPFIEVESINAIVDLLKNEKVHIGTLCKRVTNESFLFDYNVVKLVKDLNDKVLYFSRQAIPAIRDQPFRDWFSSYRYFQHLGIYGFKKNVLLDLVAIPPSGLELAEKLEQLRWLESGYTIYAKEVISESFGIDTQEDLDRARTLYR
jgi:3-deoxy-manno-octulosonate cytidylyltransferase (CMP-KDO synthetase)